MQTWGVFDEFKRFLKLSVHELYQSTFELEIRAQEAICDQLEHCQVLSCTEPFLEEYGYFLILELSATISLNGREYRP
jgi:hypothetical protein